MQVGSGGAMSAHNRQKIRAKMPNLRLKICRDRSDAVRILQLTWDDPTTAYGGVPTVVRNLASDQSQVLTYVLPSANRLQFTGPQTALHLTLHSFRESLVNLIQQNSINVVHAHNVHQHYCPGVAEALQDVLHRTHTPHLSTVHDFAEKNCCRREASPAKHP